LKRLVRGAWPHSTALRRRLKIFATEPRHRRDRRCVDVRQEARSGAELGVKRFIKAQEGVRGRAGEQEIRVHGISG
jgi:hypothetical protein